MSIELALNTEGLTFKVSNVDDADNVLSLSMPVFHLSEAKLKSIANEYNMNGLHFHCLQDDTLSFTVMKD